MKEYYKKCKNTKQVNNYLKRLNLKDFMIDEDYFNTEYFKGEEQIDQWLNEKETKEICVTIIRQCYGYDVFVNKYTKNDL